MRSTRSSPSPASTARGRHVEPGIPLDPELPAVEGFRLVLANLADAIEVNRQGTIDDVDSEFLHDLRVAVRRSRSILRHGRHVLGARRAGMGRAGPQARRRRHRARRATSTCRCSSGTTPSPSSTTPIAPRSSRCAASSSATGTAAHDDARRAARAPATSRTCCAAGTTSCTRRWTPTAPASLGGDPLGDVVATRIRKAQRRLLEHGRAITPDTPAEDVHDVRKDAKKLRYLLECFADLFPAEGRKAFVKRLKKLQDLLGEHQDAEVHAVELRRAAELLPATTGTATYVAVGRLVEHLERTRQAARDGFAERFAEYDSKPTRRLLRDMLDGVGR